MQQIYVTIIEENILTNGILYLCIIELYVLLQIQIHKYNGQWEQEKECTKNEIYK